MAMTNAKAYCLRCNIHEMTYKWKECSYIFCFNYLTDHRENINKEFNQTEDDFKSFRQILNDQKDYSETLSLIQKIVSHNS